MRSKGMSISIEILLVLVVSLTTVLIAVAIFGMGREQLEAFGLSAISGGLGG